VESGIAEIVHGFHVLHYTIRMIDTLVSAIDSEITVLKQVRALLTGNPAGPKHGRPTRSKFTMSADARARIAAAQRKRWAVWKKNKAAK
jgi:hypothetical protein